MDWALSIIIGLSISVLAWLAFGTAIYAIDKLPRNGKFHFLIEEVVQPLLIILAIGAIVAAFSYGAHKIIYGSF